MTLLVLSTESDCLQTAVRIFCLPFIVFVHRVIVCWISTFRSMAGHAASVPFCHNTVFIWMSLSLSSSVLSSSPRFECNGMLAITVSPLQLTTCWSIGLLKISIRCELLSFRPLSQWSSGIWMGCASDNDDLRDVIDTLSSWSGCDKWWLTLLLVVLSFILMLSPCNDIWMTVASLLYAFEFDWFAFDVWSASGGCCSWAWWGANC